MALAIRPKVREQKESILLEILIDEIRQYGDLQRLFLMLPSDRVCTGAYVPGSVFLSVPRQTTNFGKGRRFPVLVYDPVTGAWGPSGNPGDAPIPLSWAGIEPLPVSEESVCRL